MTELFSVTDEAMAPGEVSTLTACRSSLHRGAVVLDVCEGDQISAAMWITVESLRDLADWAERATADD